MRKILISGHFGGEANLKKFNYLTKIVKEMTSLELSVCVANYSQDKIKLNIDEWNIPKSIRSLPARIEKNFNIMEGEKDLHNLNQLVLHESQILHKFSGKPLNVCKLYLLNFYLYMSQNIQKENIDIVLIWNQFNSRSLIVAKVAKSLGVPVLYLEYGAFPNSVAIEHDGQGAESWVASRTAKFLKLNISSSDVEKAINFNHYMLSHKLSNKIQINQEDESFFEKIKSLRDKSLKIIFYAGSNDLHAGLYPRATKRSHYHSPYLESSLSALKLLDEIAEKNNLHIIYKPHPAINDKINFPLKATTVFKEVDIFECIAQADLTLTIISQVAYYALIMEKPLGLLGKTQLTHKKCCYELNEFKDLEALLARALIQGLTDEQKKYWKKHLAQQLKYYLFSLENGENEFVDRKTPEAVKYIMGRKNHFLAQLAKKMRIKLDCSKTNEILNILDIIDLPHTDYLENKMKQSGRSLS